VSAPSDLVAVDVAVSSDLWSRTLTVQAAGRTGRDAVLFRSGVRGLLDARPPDGGAPTWEAYVRSSHMPVPAHFGDRRAVAQGVPDEDGTVRFRFDRGNPLYAELVGKPLRAVAVVDRSTCRVVSVRFRHRLAR